MGGIPLSFELTFEEGTSLVKLARYAITNYLESQKQIMVPSDVTEKMFQKCGVFVTLNILRRGSEELRGCIGYPTPELPLVEAIINAAISAAFRDPRFPPVEKKELANIIVEVSILTPPNLIKVNNPQEYPNHVKIGQDGLIVENGWFRGLLLPQVPVEWGWDSEEFLSHCCIKAGLSPEAWIIPETKIFKFQALIFKEKVPKGEIEEVKLQ